MAGEWRENSVKMAGKWLLRRIGPQLQTMKFENSWIADFYLILSIDWYLFWRSYSFVIFLLWLGAIAIFIQGHDTVSLIGACYLFTTGSYHLCTLNELQLLIPCFPALFAAPSYNLSTYCGDFSRRKSILLTTTDNQKAGTSLEIHHDVR